MRKINLTLGLHKGWSRLFLIAVCGVSAFASGGAIGQGIDDLWKPINFVDVTATMGIVTEHVNDPDVPSPPLVGTGAAWADCDKDGDLDLYITNFGAANHLYLNEGTTFTDIAAASGVRDEPRNGSGVTFVDFDNDGDEDLFVVAYGADVLYENDGDCNFKDITGTSGLGGKDQRSTSAAWADYDNDGLLDVYVGNHHYFFEFPLGGPVLPPMSEDHLYRNLGGGVFEEVTSLLPVGSNTLGLTHAATFFDYDNDGDDDLFVGTDCSVSLALGEPVDDSRNRLYRNDGPMSGSWQFTDVSNESGLDFCMATMGTALGDLNNDGYFDLGLTDGGSPKIMINQGDGTFEDEAELLMDVPNTISWGIGFFDFDNSSWQDIHYVAGATVSLPSTPGQLDSLFMNRFEGTIWTNDLATSAGIQGVDTDPPDQGRTSAYADFDGDGLVDVLVINRGGAVQLFQNVGPAAPWNWLTLELEGMPNNKNAVGAKVSVTAGWNNAVATCAYRFKLRCGRYVVSAFWSGRRDRGGYSEHRMARRDFDDKERSTGELNLPDPARNLFARCGL